ncbi:hypothetical protein H9Y04_14970 [Streptomyces sp. TRM66268-LWL]|uniref:Uncharacterized protein n=1 Tax=Streptomyces polyasparticus TaxID=2767826 RepID=A0ABR7SEF1_9ACTN|nr:hypothetical protein [Streptomyces polyasparticus]MBC9713871.1 hypothetical protein [Streptomyces polyasparticus]
MQVVLRVLPLPGGDLEDLARDTGFLSAELADMPDVLVRPLPDGAVPEDAMGLGSVVGWLLVDLPASGALTALLTLVHDWAGRVHRTVDIEVNGHTLKATGLTAKQLDAVIHGYFARLDAG